MGIDYDCKIIFGWKVEYQDVYNFALKFIKESLGIEEDNIDIDLSDLGWNFKIEGLSFEIIQSSPYYDSHESKRDYFLGIEFKKVSLEKMEQLSQVTKRDWYPRLYEIVKKLDGYGDPCIMKVINIW